MNQCNNAKILSCDLIKDKWIAKSAELIKKYDMKLQVAIIMVGENPASEVYVANKLRNLDNLGIKSQLHKFEYDVEQKEIESLIKFLNEDEFVTGIFIQLPIAKHLDETHLINCIDPKKDIDALTATNIGAMYQGDFDLLPCTASGIRELFIHENIEIAGKNAVVIGRSTLAAKPIAQFLENGNATVTICHSKTKDIKFYTKNADIVVIAVGVPRMLDASYVKKGVVIIDVGMNRVDGKLCGDADFDNLLDIAAMITPVPGGVGLLTVAGVINNVVRLQLNAYEVDNA